VDGGEQVALIGLMYGSMADARVAADVLPRRLSSMSSLVTLRPFSDLLEDRQVSSVTGRVVTADDDGTSVAVVELLAPLAGDQPDPDTGFTTSSSLVYRMLVDMVYRRDTLWLAPDLPLMEAP
jgi:hypothetical protein